MRMFRRLAAVGILAGAVLGAVTTGSAHAGGPPGQQFDQNLQIAPITLCNVEVNVIAVPVDVLSPNTTGDCINGPTLVNLDSDRAWEAIPDGADEDWPSHTGY
jgi:hypothetical protein